MDYELFNWVCRLFKKYVNIVVICHSGKRNPE